MEAELSSMINKIIQGDCLEVLKTFPENSIDTIITDPPYGLEFMGKEWDKLGGGIEKTSTSAGGFSRRGKEKGDNPYANSRIRYGKSVKSAQQWHFNWAKECLRVTKPGATLLCFGGTRTWHRLACAIEDAGWVIKDTIMWIHGQGFPKAGDIGKQLDKRSGKKGKLIKIQKLGGTSATLKGKANRKDWYDQGKGGTFTPQLEIREPATPEAKTWSGYKSHGLKPAYEPIIMAMKPNEGSYAENALKWGVAGLNINEARIGVEKVSAHHAPKGTFAGGEPRKSDTNYYNNQGRFPSNLILDEESAKILDEMSGERKSGKGKANTYEKFGGQWGQGKQIRNADYSDSGGASRFFYVAKASRAERNRGCEGFSNNHPTVKSLKLMEYLCILTKTPTGGIILDPFAGSGTTCIAAKKIGRDFIGIEKEAEYVKIAEARINSIQQSTLF